MPRYIFFVLFIAFSAACEKQPVIPINKMSELLLRMHLAESYAKLTPRIDTLPEGLTVKRDDSLLKYNAMILQEFDVTKSEFESSLEYYKKRPALLDSVYQLVLSEIAVLQANHKKKLQ